MIKAAFNRDAATLTEESAEIPPMQSFVEENEAVVQNTETESKQLVIHSNVPSEAQIEGTLCPEYILEENYSQSIKFYEDFVYDCGVMMR